MSDSLIQDLEDILREVAAEAVMPRFQALREHEIAEKSGPGDLVTVADREAEAILTRRLPDLFAAAVVGEEGVAADPRAIEGLKADAVWTVDPVDGTANFVEGSDRFALMVSLIRGGETVLGAIFPPVDGRCALTERGAGAFFGGERIESRKDVPFERAYGDYSHIYVDEPLRSQFLKAFEEAGGTRQGRCSAFAYLDVARGEADFVMQYKMSVWDHAPGVLLVDEAGGRTAMLKDGAPYRPVKRPEAPMLACGDRAMWDDYAKRLNSLTEPRAEKPKG